MTFVSEQLFRLDAQLDKLLQHDRVFLSESSVYPDEDSYTLSPTSTRSEGAPLSTTTSQPRLPARSAHAENLQKIIRQLGIPTERSLSSSRLITLLRDAKITRQTTEEIESLGDYDVLYEQELEWLLLSKAAIQTYGIIATSLVEQTLPLSQDLFYWEEVLASDLNTTIYALQTAPQRLWSLSKEVYSEVARRIQDVREMERFPVPFSDGAQVESAPDLQPRREHKAPLSQTAREYYGLVKNVVSSRYHAYQVGVIAPLSRVRQEIFSKQTNIHKLRERQASALGVLIGEGLSFSFDEDHEEWRSIIERAVVLIENVVCHVTSVDRSLDEFEETVFMLDRPRSSQEEDEEPTTSSGLLHAQLEGRAATAALSVQLQEILLQHLPAQTARSHNLMGAHGRPSTLTRYWLPATALLLSSTTILRIFVNRREEIQTWFAELGATIIDFWANWVIEPTRKVIGTIRHSEDSEVALMSRKSLAADMESLERMVADFVADNPSSLAGASETDLALVKARVKEGDLTPVLRAYERDLRSPFMGTVRGDLVRALLIQVQKTKVDVEVAISGIDRLLKSQELVFGFVGLTPGIIVCLGVSRWFLTTFRGRGQKGGQKRTERMVWTLRNIDRILTASNGLRGENSGSLTYKEHGLLLCEVHVLRESAKRALPKPVWAKFSADLEELIDVRKGVLRQSRVLDRMRWAYAKWLK